MKVSDILRQKNFIITLEINPPSGADIYELEKEFSLVKGKVDAVNITDMPGANLKMSPWAAGLWAVKFGLNPIVQYTCRDRNELAIKGDIFGLASFQIENVLVLGGDPTHIGDHPGASPVFDLDTVSFIRWISENTEMCVGAAVNPGAEDISVELSKMEAKLDAGARFFQTQAVYEPDKFERFMEKAKKLGAPVIAGIIPLRSEKMALFMNENIPGIYVPEDMIRRIATAEDKIACGQEIALEIIDRIRPLCNGVHIMPIKRIDTALPIIDRVIGGASL